MKYNIEVALDEGIKLFNKLISKAKNEPKKWTGLTIPRVKRANEQSIKKALDKYHELQKPLWDNEEEE